MSQEEITREQLQQLVTDIAAQHPNVQVAQPGQFPADEDLMGSIFAGVEMYMAIADAARDCNAARPDLGPDKIAAMMLRHGDFVAGWNNLDDRARTELMCTYTAAAVSSQARPEAIAGDRLHHTFARHLLELGHETAAAGQPLIPDPANPLNTPVWCYAVSTVCASDPELAKIRAVCLLAASAAKAGAAADAGGA